MGLRRARVREEVRKGLFGGVKELRLWISPENYYRLRGQELRELTAAGTPAAVGTDQGRTLWATPDGYYWDDEGHSVEEVDLVLWDRRRRKDHRLERLRQQREASGAAEQARRERIPPDVQVFVWERDGGRCVKCGVSEDLQLDHVIPIAKRGGNAAENVQLLCGSCNRLKSDTVG